MWNPHPPPSRKAPRPAQASGFSDFLARLGFAGLAFGAFGGAGTIGFVAASLIAGVLAEMNIRLPFWFFSGVMVICLGTGLLVAGRALFTFGQAVPDGDVEAEAAGGV